MGEGERVLLDMVCRAIRDAHRQEASVVAESHNHWERVYRMMTAEPGTPRVEVHNRRTRERSDDPAQ